MRVGFRHLAVVPPGSQGQVCECVRAQTFRRSAGRGTTSPGSSWTSGGLQEIPAAALKNQPGDGFPHWHK